MKTRIYRSFDEEITIVGISEGYLPAAGVLTAVAALLAASLGAFTDILGATCIFLLEEIGILVLIYSVQTTVPWRTLRSRINALMIPRIIHFRPGDILYN